MTGDLWRVKRDACCTKCSMWGSFMWKCLAFGKWGEHCHTILIPLLFARERCCRPASTRYLTNISTSNKTTAESTHSREKSGAGVYSRIGRICNLFAQENANAYAEHQEFFLLVTYNSAISAVRLEQVQLANEGKGTRPLRASAPIGPFSSYPSTTSRLPF